MHVHAADENQALIKVALDALALACGLSQPWLGLHARLRKKRAGLIMHACIRPVAR